MRKIFFLILSLTVCSTCFAAFVRFNNDYDGQNLNASNAEQFLLANYAFEDGTKLVEIKTVTDNIGMVHTTLQQYVNGHAVDGAILLIHSKSGIVTSINGGYMSTNSVPNCVIRKKARKIARQMPAKSAAQGNDYIYIRVEDNYRPAFVYNSPDGLYTYYVDAETNEVIKTTENFNNSSANGTAITMLSGSQTIKYSKQDGYNYLIDEDRNITTVEAKNFDNNEIYPYESSSSQWDKCVVAKVTLSFSTTDWWSSIIDGSPEFYIKILNDKNEVLYTSGYFGTYTPVSWTILPNKTIESTGNLKIQFWEYDNTIEGGSDDCCSEYVSITKTEQGTYQFSGSKISGSYTILSNPAYDIHWGMEQTYDFYKSTFNMESVDGKGAPLINLVNPPSNFALFKESGYPNNASSISSRPGFFAFGMGDFETFGPLVAVDIMGHEFTHAVTAANAGQNLPGKGEGGALNEGFADMFGAAVERYTYGTTDWEVGTQVTMNGSCLRSLKDPKQSTRNLSPGPNTYKGNLWDPELEVHTNATVAGYWFYLLCNGGSGTIDDKGVVPYSVTAIGMDKAIQIAYSTLLYHVTSESTYATIRGETLAAAKELYGAQSDEVKSVTNAWHAVGIGGKYAEEFSLPPGKYAIVASRAKDTDKNWFYMSATKDGTKERFQAINSEKTDINAINLKDLSDAYIWELVADGSKWKLKNGSQYISWTSNNTAKLDATGKSLTFNIADNQVEAFFNDGTADRYLSLNGTTGNNFFAFYGNKNQITHLFFLPVEGTTPTPPTPPTPTEKEYYIVAKRSTGNYYFFTPDKVSGKERLIAVDAGTSIRSQIDTINTSADYLWSLEDAQSGKLLKNHNGSYLTCAAAKSAAMATAGKELTVTNNNDGTVTFSYAADATTTHYLSLANAGNDYFVFYANTNQVTHLLLLPKGNGTATSIEDFIEAPKPKKFMRDGQILINCDGVLYNMMGQKVQ